MQPAKPNAHSPHSKIDDLGHAKSQKIAREQFDRGPPVGVALGGGSAGDGEPVQVGEVGLVVVEDEGFDAHVAEDFDEHPAGAHEVGQLEEGGVGGGAVGGLGVVRGFDAEEVEDGGWVGGVEEGFERVALRDDGVGEVGGAGDFGVEGWTGGAEDDGSLDAGGVLGGGGGG